MNDTQERAIEDAKEAAKASAKKRWKDEGLCFAEIVEHGFDAGYQAERWVAVTEPDDLPDEFGLYVWKIRGADDYHVRYFDYHLEADNCDTWTEIYSHYQKIVGPQAIGGSE